MKVLNIIFSSLLLILFASCDETEWKEAGATPTSIYSITDISGEYVMHAIEIYKDKNLHIEFENVSTLKSFALVDFEDETSTEAYKVNYTLERDALTEDERDTMHIRYYELTGTSIDSVGVYKLHEITAEKDTVLLATSDCTVFIDQRLY